MEFNVGEFKSYIVPYSMYNFKEVLSVFKSRVYSNARSNTVHIKVIIDKSRGEVSLLEQDTIENVT